MDEIWAKQPEIKKGDSQWLAFNQDHRAAFRDKYGRVDAWAEIFISWMTRECGNEAAIFALPTFVYLW